MAKKKYNDYEDQELPPRIVHGVPTYYLRKCTNVKAVRLKTPVWDED